MKGSMEATTAQLNFIATLVTERVPSEKRAATDARLAQGLDKALASQWIERLLDMPKLATAVVVADAPAVPEGRYAVEIDGTLGFFKVDAPTEGKWAGRVFVKQMASTTSSPSVARAAPPSWPPSRPTRRALRTATATRSASAASATAP